MEAGDVETKLKRIPKELVDFAEKLTDYINKNQLKKGLPYPMGLKASQLIVMATARGLKEIAQEVGYSEEKAEESREETVSQITHTDSEDKEFLKKLMEGF